MMFTVVNKRDVLRKPNQAYIGRPSPLGNPFVLGRDGTRAEVIEKYEGWFRAQVVMDNAAVLGELRRIWQLAQTHGHVELVCWCAPLACHGDVIKRFLDEHRR